MSAMPSTGCRSLSAERIMSPRSSDWENGATVAGGSAGMISFAPGSGLATMAKL